ncbi:hypothetical protein E2N92_12350 [Methanofollis formosanus]|uniref:Uncharacterized protein n=1 Tax=Methanofollis formosanus TaxID=299308 RepID=A0A8G1EHM6_9EURY|nr:hypothetical protein [Methanofollis formosanus]QYZ80162.1 hypothetical protein E2N92_12350 [Methanofollis formosanus]
MGGVVTVPIISSIEPAVDCIIDTVESFFDRLFEITIDVASTVDVWLNDVVAFTVSTYETFVSWFFDRATTVVETGENIIRIVVANAAGSTERIIHAVITETPVTSAPEITSTIPLEQSISNVPGGSNTRTFGATVDQSTTVIFSVEGQEKRRFNAVTNAAWECDFSEYSAGTHSVVVTASNSNGSDSFTWSWEILEQPVITFVTPSADSVSNYDAEGKRVFQASVNIPCLLELYLNDRLLEKSSSEDTAISHEFGTVPLGSHTIKVVAKKDGTTVEDFWDWNVTEYPPLGTQKVVLCKTFTKATSRTHTDHYLVVTHATLMTYLSEELRSEKCQLPDGSWIYLFHLAVRGSITDDEGGEPPIVRSAVASHYDDRMYLSDFDIVQIDIEETENKDKQVLFSAFDPLCYGIFPLKDGEIRNISDNTVAYDLVCSVLGILPIPGCQLISAAFVFSRLCGLCLADTTRIERIYESFAYEEHEDVRETSGVIFGPCDVTNYIRWIVWVNKDQTIRFNLNVKLFENADDFMELNEEISIDSSQDPIAL